MLRNVMIVVLLSAFALAAQTPTYSERKLKLAERGHLANLQSDNEALRNSAIFRIMQLKACAPHYNFTKIIAALQQASQKDPSFKNRLYAFTAYTILSDASLVAIPAPPKSEEDKEEYFATLQRLLMEKTQLTQAE